MPTLAATLTSAGLKPMRSWFLSYDCARDTRAALTIRPGCGLNASEHRREQIDAIRRHYNRLRRYFDLARRSRDAVARPGADQSNQHRLRGAEESRLPANL